MSENSVSKHKKLEEHELSSWIASRLESLVAEIELDNGSYNEPKVNRSAGNSRIQKYFDDIKKISDITLLDKRPNQTGDVEISHRDFSILFRSLRGFIDDSQFLEEKASNSMSYFLDSSEIIGHAVPSTQDINEFSIMGLLADVDNRKQQNLVYGTQTDCIESIFENKNDRFKISVLPSHWDEVFGFLRDFVSRTAHADDYRIRFFNDATTEIENVLGSADPEKRSKILNIVYNLLGERREETDEKYIKDARLFFNAYCGFSEKEISDFENTNLSISDARRLVEMLDKYDIEAASSRNISNDLGDRVGKRFVEENVGFGSVGRTKKNVALRKHLIDIFAQFSLIILERKSKTASDRRDAEALLQCIRLNLLSQQNGNSIRYRIISRSMRMNFVAAAIGELTGEDWIASCIRHPLFIPEIYVQFENERGRGTFSDAANKLNRFSTMFGNYTAFIQKNFRSERTLELYKNELSDLRAESNTAAMKVYSLLSGRLFKLRNTEDGENIAKTINIENRGKNYLKKLHHSIIKNLSDQIPKNRSVSEFTRVVSIHVKIFEKNNIVSELRQKNKNYYQPRLRIINLVSFIQPNYRFLYFPFGHYRHVVKYSKDFVSHVSEQLLARKLIKIEYFGRNEKNRGGVWILTDDSSALLEDLFISGDLSVAIGSTRINGETLTDIVDEAIESRDELCSNINQIIREIKIASFSVDKLLDKFDHRLKKLTIEAETILWLCHILVSDSNARLVSSILRPICTCGIQLVQAIKKSSRRNDYQNLLTLANIKQSAKTKDRFITLLREVLFMRHCCARSIAYDVHSDRWDEERLYAKSRRDLQYCDDLHLFSSTHVDMNTEMYQFRIKCASIATFFEISLTNIVAHNKEISNRHIDYQNLNFRLEVWPIYDYIQKLKVYMEFFTAGDQSTAASKGDKNQIDQSGITIKYLHMRTLQLYFTGMIVFSLYNNGHGISQLWSSGAIISDDELQPFDGYEHRLIAFERLSKELAKTFYGAENVVSANPHITSNIIIISIIKFLRFDLIKYRQLAQDELSSDAFEKLEVAVSKLLTTLNSCEMPSVPDTSEFTFRKSGYYYSLIRRVKEKLEATIGEIRKAKSM